MSTFVIGDVHGCFNELQRLLSSIKFNPEKDKAIFVGDLVGRGPHSLEVLNFIIALGEAAIHILGNYDIRLLGMLYGVIAPTQSENLSHILKSGHKMMYADWLSSSKLIYYSRELNIVVTHAGIPPQWTLEMAIEYAKNFETYKSNAGMSKTLRDILLVPSCLIWNKRMKSEDVIRYTVFGFTKMKYCHHDGTFDELSQGVPEEAPDGLIPWFKLRCQKYNEHERLIFGHWAALGLFQEDSIVCCDTGCVWGGKLTALQIGEEMKIFQVKSYFDANLIQLHENKYNKKI